jgi:hypothetical protein
MVPLIDRAGPDIVNEALAPTFETDVRMADTDCDADRRDGQTGDCEAASTKA